MTDSTTRSVTIGHILRSTVMRPNNNNNNDNVYGAVIMSTSYSRASRNCNLSSSVRKPAVDAHRPLRKAPLDAQRPVRSV